MSVTLHTTLGDLRIYCDTALAPPLTSLLSVPVEPTMAPKMHRNIKGFMMQAGDTAERLARRGERCVPFDSVVGFHSIRIIEYNSAKLKDSHVNTAST
jgi:cyclophilin family peptidyl-prolyl cis-trans isomerase